MVRSRAKRDRRWRGAQAIRWRAVEAGAIRRSRFRPWRDSSFVFRRDDAASSARGAYRRLFPCHPQSLLFLSPSLSLFLSPGFPRAARSRDIPAEAEKGRTVGKRPVCASASPGGGILNLGGSIDFTIWTPPKVKNKPSQTYSTLIECLSSARLVSTHGRDGDTKRET